MESAYLDVFIVRLFKPPPAVENTAKSYINPEGYFTEK